MRQLVEDTLKEMGHYSPDSANIILGTIAQESAYGKYRKQIGGGPALGICQIEPNTFNDIVFNFLRYKKELNDLILSVCGVTDFDPADLELNDKLSICFCRCQYLRFPEKIPSTLYGYANLWKFRYNTVKGAGKVEEFIDNYHKYVDKDILVS